MVQIMERTNLKGTQLTGNTSASQWKYKIVLCLLNLFRNNEENDKERSTKSLGLSSSFTAATNYIKRGRSNLWRYRADPYSHSRKSKLTQTTFYSQNCSTFISNSGNKSRDQFCPILLMLSFIVMCLPPKYVIHRIKTHTKSL